MRIHAKVVSCKRILMLSALLSLILLVAGCRIHTEIWVNKTGTGHGTMKLTGIPATLEQVKAEVNKDFRGFSNDFSVDGSMGTYNVKFNYNDIRHFNNYSLFEPQKDGGLKVNLGKVELGSLTAHVDGSIDKELTKRGKITNSDTIVFENEQAEFYYKPGVPIAKYLFRALIGLLVVAAGFVAFLFFKRKQSALIVAETPSKSAPKFCGDCGFPLSTNDTFCGECGKKRV